MAGKSISDLAPTHMQPLSGDHILPLRAKHGPERNGRCPRFSAWATGFTAMNYQAQSWSEEGSIFHPWFMFFSTKLGSNLHGSKPVYLASILLFYIIILIYIYILYIIVHYSPVLSLFHGQGSPSANLLMSTAQLWPFGIDGVPVVYARWSSCSPIFDSDCW